MAANVWAACVSEMFVTFCHITYVKSSEADNHISGSNTPLFY